MNRIERLQRIATQSERLIVGLMSGTSLDGVDAALCRVSGSGRATRIEQLAFRCTSYEPALRQEIEQTLRGSVADVCALNVRLGEVFAEAALAVIEEAGLAPADVDAIASHGQTVYHVDQSRGTPATLQIGEASVIAERTGAIVVSDFRPRDIAAGGGGAPLVAYLDDCLFAREGEVRLLQNLGGIANVTAVTHDPSRSIAFDTGPGNLPIDAVTRVLTSGRARYDEDGNYSRLGEVDQALLDHLCEHPFLAAPPPKTTGREEFGDAFSQALIESYDPARLIDLLATLVRFTARSIARAYREHLVPRTGPIHEVIVSGGGVHNLTLMAAIRDELDGLAPVSSFDDLDVGFSADAKEAVAFCVLGNETLQGLPSNLPAATGARRAVVLGKIVL